MMKGFPRHSYYGKSHVVPTRDGSAPAPKNQINSFEQEYQKFIEDLKANKEAEAQKAEAPVLTEEPKVEAEVIPETVTTVAEDAPVLNEEAQPKKTKKKKTETVAEPTIDGLD